MTKHTEENGNQKNKRSAINGELKYSGLKKNQTLAMHFLSSLLSVSADKVSADDCPPRP